jgi:hypothetical protein
MRRKHGPHIEFPDRVSDFFGTASFCLQLSKTPVEGAWLQSLLVHSLAHAPAPNPVHLLRSINKQEEERKSPSHRDSHLQGQCIHVRQQSFDAASALLFSPACSTSSPQIFHSVKGLLPFEVQDHAPQGAR